MSSHPCPSRVLVGQIVLIKPFNSDVLPAALGSVWPTFAAVDLYGNAAALTDDFCDLLLIVFILDEGGAVKLIDFDTVDPGGHLGRISFNPDARRVPILHETST